MSVEAAVERHDPIDAVPVHHGEVDGITRGERV
jgi:hypothetical protein